MKEGGREGGSEGGRGGAREGAREGGRGRLRRIKNVQQTINEILRNAGRLGESCCSR